MRLSVQNFRSIASLTLETRPGLTVVVGRSDVGKSNLIRAIHALVEGVGVGAVKYGEKELRVSIDGVEYRKGPKTNAYTINSRVITGHGREVPDAILRALPFPTIYTGDRVLRPSIQMQSEAIFLLDSSAPELARTLGGLSGLHIVLVAVRKASAELRRLKAATDANDKELATLKESWKPVIEEAKARVEQARTAAPLVEEYERRAGSLARLREVPARLTSLTERISAAEGRVTSYGAIESPVPRAQALMQKKRALALHNEVVSATKRLQRIQAAASSTSGICERVPRILKAREIMQAITRNESAAIEARVSLVKTKEAIASYEGQIAATTCPVCGRTG